MRPLSVVHVASFLGNIGDNANHFGFRPWFEQLTGCAIEWREFEIRNVYRKLTAFDANFASICNDADLVVIGGGNYFEMWVETSPTGTSISIDDDVFSKIRTPIFFNALGVDEGQGVTQTTLQKFRKFLERILISDNYLLSVRNDGARATLEKYASDLPLDKVVALPDGGLFADWHAKDEIDSGRVKRSGMRLAINLAGDMLDRRFSGGSLHDYEGFLDELADVLRRLNDTVADLELVFVPHVFADLKIYADLLARLPDKLRREQVRVAAYDNGNEAARIAFAQYIDSDIVLAMRFHANVVPIANGIPTIGLSCYDQIPHFYRELQLETRQIDVRAIGFGDDLVESVHQIISDPTKIRAELEKVRRMVSSMRKSAEDIIRPWLQRHRMRPL